MLPMHSLKLGLVMRQGLCDPVSNAVPVHPACTFTIPLLAEQLVKKGGRKLNSDIQHM
jgi:hypothetical protein